MPVKPKTANTSEKSGKKVKNSKTAVRIPLSAYKKKKIDAKIAEGAKIGQKLAGSVHITLNTLKYYCRTGRQNEGEKLTQRLKVFDAAYQLAQRNRKKGQKTRVTAREMRKKAELEQVVTVRSVRRYVEGVIHHRKHSRGQPNHEITRQQSQAMEASLKYR